jgi:hypothetical protein
MAEILGIQAFSSGALVDAWWEWTLVAIIGASGLIGIIAFVWASFTSIRKFLKVSSTALPATLGSS